MMRTAFALAAQDALRFDEVYLRVDAEEALQSAHERLFLRRYLAQCVAEHRLRHLDVDVENYRADC